jgi:hypothetical protein
MSVCLKEYGLFPLNTVIIAKQTLIYCFISFCYNVFVNVGFKYFKISLIDFRCLWLNYGNYIL